MLLLLALKQFSAPLVGYAAALLVQSLFWNRASKKGLLYLKCCSIHPLEKTPPADPAGALRSWDYFLTKGLWYSCPFNVFISTGLIATGFISCCVWSSGSLFSYNTVYVVIHNKQIRKWCCSPGPSLLLVKQRVWKGIFQKCWHLLAAHVMCLSKAFYLIIEM